MGIICACSPYLPQFIMHLRNVLPPLIDRLPYSKHFSSLTSSIRHPIHPNRTPSSPANQKDLPRSRPAKPHRFRHPNDLPSTIHDSELHSTIAAGPTPRHTRNRFTHFFSTSRTGGGTTAQGDVSQATSIWGLGAAKKGLSSMFSTTGGGMTRMASDKSAVDSEKTITVAEEGSMEKLHEEEMLERPAPVEHNGEERVHVHSRASPGWDNVGRKEWV